MPSEEDAAPALVPELVSSDIARSRRFYVDTLGFRVLFERPEERFVYLAREGAEIMLEEPTGRSFVIAELQQPYGRGVNLQIRTTEIDDRYQRVTQAGAPVLWPIEDAAYGVNETVVQQRQFVVQDPDGYLLRFYTDTTHKEAS